MCAVAYCILIFLLILVLILYAASIMHHIMDIYRLEYNADSCYRYPNEPVVMLVFDGLLYFLKIFVLISR